MEKKMCTLIVFVTHKKTNWLSAQIFCARKQKNLADKCMDFVNALSPPSKML